MNKQTKEGLFSNQDLWVLILPLMIEQFLAISVGMADTMMVSHAGEAAVSGVSLVDMVNNVIIALLAALATGGAVIISQCIGAGRGGGCHKGCRTAGAFGLCGGRSHCSGLHCPGPSPDWPFIWKY